MVASESEVVARIRAKSDTSGFNEFTVKLNDLKHNAQEMGRAMTVVGGIISAAMGTAVFAAAGFEQKMRAVNSLINVSEGEFNDLSRQVRDSANALGVSAVEAAKSFYAVFSQGVPKENALDFLQVATKLGVAGMTSTESAVDSLAQVMDAFAMPMDKVREAGDKLFAGVIAGQMPIESFARIMGTIGPVAAYLGFSFDEVAASVATLRGQGIPTQKVLMGLQGIMGTLARPTKEMQNAVANVIRPLTDMGIVSGDVAERYTNQSQVLGVYQQQLADVNGMMEAQRREFGAVSPLLQRHAANISDAIKDMNAEIAANADEVIMAMAKNLGFAGTMEMLSGATGGTQQGMMKLWGSLESGKAALGLTGQHTATLKDNMDKLKSATEAEGAVEKSYQEQRKGTLYQLNELKNGFINLAIDIGMVFLPIFEPIIGDLRLIVQSVMDFAKANPELVRTLFLIGGPLGIFLGTVGMLLPKLMALVPLIQGIGIAAGVGAGPVGWIVLALAGLTAGIILLATNWDWVVNKWNQGWYLMETVAQNVVNGIIAVLNGLIGAYNTVAKFWGGQVSTITPVSFAPAAPPSAMLGAGVGEMEGLPSFHGGGTVPGIPGTPVPVMAMAGERFSMPGSGSSSLIVQIFPAGHVITSNDLVDEVYAGLLKKGLRNNLWFTGVR